MFNSMKYLLGSLIAVLFTVHDIEFDPITKNYGLKTDQGENKEEILDKKKDDGEEVTWRLEGEQEEYINKTDSTGRNPDQPASGSIPF
jgi:hypothetical protein